MGPVDDFWCSEDTLFGFREWLVEQGRLVYEAAIADPDSLADNPELDDSLPWGKGTWGVAMTVYEQRTGEELPGLEGWSGELIGGLESLHSLWNDPEELRRRYPRLWVRFRQPWPGATRPSEVSASLEAGERTGHQHKRKPALPAPIPADLQHQRDEPAGSHGKVVLVDGA